MKLPGWVLKHKVKGTEIRNFKGRYYLYQISSKWDSKSKTTKKVTGKFLGKITSEGLVKPRREREAEMLAHITVKEYGAACFAAEMSRPFEELLKKHFPLEWSSILVFAIMRLFYSSPLKNVSHHFYSSHLSDLYSAQVSPKSLSDLLFSLGERRHTTGEFMKTFVIGSDFTVIDLTHIFSLSENVISSTLGHNSEKEYVPQVNLTLLFSLDKKHPVFFRIVPGSIRDVSTIPLTLREAGVEKAVVIGDKGFTSRSNTGFLEEQHLEYILPMKRNDSIIDYSPLQQADRRGLNGYFFFEGRCVWFYEKKQEKNRTILFLDERLKTEEEKDFLTHVDNKKLTMEEYYKKQHTLGTITVCTNTPFTPQKVYELLKSRVEIEIVFDTLKNTLHADRTYMRDDKHLEGWMFINFIALLIYYRIYNQLTDKNLLSKYSPKDIIQHLSRVHKVKIGEKWHTSEIPKTTRNLIEKMQINLPVT